ncbi:NTP transferase domain-containing protein [Rhodococcus triatomae]|nr:NTP transferase domain-containing protein [Rhodococcus triatomae]QNG19394.1 NTP transferase domain-containing protein [Rhodococcus triatomae]QNG24693.1 NTP transferase domain-containing protein [Rhodococcus triatomae]
MTFPRVFAIILAGGAATRMGGIDKPALIVGGRRMLDTALAAIAVADRTVVVGPHRDGIAALQVQEDPPGSGPVAGIAAGLAALGTRPTDRVLVLASDLPWIGTRTTEDLLGALERTEGADAALGIDETGRVQYLLSAWRAEALADALEALDSPVNQPMRALHPQHPVTVEVAGATDCDTPEDIERARTVGPGPLTLDEAREAVRTGVAALEPREGVLAESLGATLARTLHSADAVPRADVSAMDGYAVAGPGPWHLLDEVRPAGDTGTFSLAAGEAARIATGAHLPAGATAVLRDEFAVVEARVLATLPDSSPRDDTRRRGEDWPVGHPIAPAGTAVTSALVSAASSGEIRIATVRGPVRVHVVTTGDEIRRDGPLRPGQTRDALGPVLDRFVTSTGAVPVTNAHIRDTADGFDELLRGATDVDAIVIVGATGGGAADQLRSALARARAHMLVGRVLCRPGGSLVAAALPDGRAVLGLPGNPYAAIATLLVTLPAVVDACTGRAPQPRLHGRVANASEVGTDRTRILPVTSLPDGRWIADPGVRTAHLAGLVGRPALALIPPGAVNDTVAELIPLPAW